MDSLVNYYYNPSVLSSPDFQLDLDRLHAVASGELVGRGVGYSTLNADAVAQAIMLGNFHIYVFAPSRQRAGSFLNILQPVLGDVYGFDFRYRASFDVLVVLQDGVEVANVRFIHGNAIDRRDRMRGLPDGVHVEEGTDRWPTYPERSRYS